MNRKLSPIFPGCKIGLVSPAGPVKKGQIQKGLEILTNFKIDYEFGKHAFSDKKLVSASAKDRIEDINHFLQREEIKAIWALRGGYGSMQLLKKIDYSLLRRYPKLFVGFSDLTALQWGIFKKVGIPSLSGFALTLQLCHENPFILLGMEILSGRRNKISGKDLRGNKIKIISPGKAEGIFLGGTLSMISSLCGTPYFIEQDGLILFIEDVNEPLYRIDRYLQQLALINFWSKVKGIILGQFLYEGKSLDVVSLLKSFISTSIPIISNFPYGHQTKSIPLIQGVIVQMDTKPFSLTWDKFIE